MLPLFSNGWIHGPVMNGISTMETMAQACRGTIRHSSIPEAEVREAVFRPFSRSPGFPIIRFDAAMTLTKFHYSGCGFAAGTGGDIPSRAQTGYPATS